MPTTEAIARFLSARARMTQIQEGPRSGIQASLEDGDSHTANLDGRALWRALLTNVQSTQVRECGTSRTHLLRTVLVYGSDKATAWYDSALASKRS